MDNRKRIKHVSSDRLKCWAVLSQMLANIERARVKGLRISYPYYSSWWIESPTRVPLCIGATFEEARRWIAAHP